VQPHIAPVTGGSFPGWPQAARLLQLTWPARNAEAGVGPVGLEYTIAVMTCVIT